MVIAPTMDAINSAIEVPQLPSGPQQDLQQRLCHPASSRVIRTDGIGAAGCPQCQLQRGMGPSSRHDPIDFDSNQAPEVCT